MVAPACTAPTAEASEPPAQHAAAAAATATTPRSHPATPVGEIRADFTPEQQVLFDLVRRWRRKKAHDEGVPPYVVLTNRQLVEIVLQRPHSKTAMGQIEGFGDKKLARHGTDLLAMLWPDAPAAEPIAAAADTSATAEAAS